MAAANIAKIKAGTCHLAMIHVARGLEDGKKSRAGMNVIVCRRIHIISLFPPALTPAANYDETAFSIGLLLSGRLTTSRRLDGISRIHGPRNLRSQRVLHLIARRQQ